MSVGDGSLARSFQSPARLIRSVPPLIWLTLSRDSHCSALAETGDDAVSSTVLLTRKPRGMLHRSSALSP